MLAEYINTAQANVAVMFYSGVWLVVNVAFNVWWQSMLRPVRLIAAAIGDTAVSRATLQTGSGLLIYGSTTMLAYWFPVAALVIILASQIMWVVISVEEKIATR